MIRFGNVEVPVKLHSAVGGGGVHFRLLHAEDEALVRTTMAPAPDADVIDIMEVLKQRLGAKDGEGSKGGSGARGSAKKTKSAAKDDALSDRTKDELYEQAKSLGIEGRSRMSRDQLIRAIRRSA